MIGMKGTPAADEATADRPHVVLVGAYERDNFGDLLYLLLAEEYFRSARVSITSPFSSDMTHLLGRQIAAYAPILTNRAVDHIWTVGGEVGGLTPQAAFRMSASSADLERYRLAPKEERGQVLMRSFEGPVPDSPYIPRPTAYAKNATATLGLSSVGLAYADRLDSLRREAVLSTLRMASRIIVRDEASSRFLNNNQISHVLAPDLVHTLTISRPRDQSRDTTYVLVQASQEYLTTVGIEAFAQALTKLPFAEGVDLRLFLAGTANHHDSIHSYRQLVDLLRRLDPTRGVEVSQARNPWDRVDEIASARLWIGTSLHGRITAAAYGVPRISLEVQKVSDYAATWDSDAPFGVSPEDLPAAADLAYAGATTSEDSIEGSLSWRVG